WEHFGRYHDHLEAPQFAFHFFSRAIALDKLATRDHRFVADVLDWWTGRFGAAPLSTPLAVAGRKLDGRVVAVTGSAGDAGAVPVVRRGSEELVPFHRPGARAAGGCGCPPPKPTRTCRRRWSSWRRGSPPAPAWWPSAAVPRSPGCCCARRPGWCGAGRRC